MLHLVFVKKNDDNIKKKKNPVSVGSMDYFELVFMHFLLKTRTVQRSGRETEILIRETLTLYSASLRRFNIHE